MQNEGIRQQSTDQGDDIGEGRSTGQKGKGSWHPGRDAKMRGLGDPRQELLTNFAKTAFKRCQEPEKDATSDIDKIEQSKRPTLGSEREHLKGGMDNNKHINPIDFLKLEEHEILKSGEKSRKANLVGKIIFSAQTLLDAKQYTKSDIEEILNKAIRNSDGYKQNFGGEGSSSQQQKEVIVLSDSEEDGEKSPKQKQQSESQFRKEEKRQLDQAQEDTPPSKRQRIEVDPNQYQLREQQHNKGKEQDTMEAHGRTGPHDELEELNKTIKELKNKQEKLSKRIEEDKKEIKKIEDPYSNECIKSLKYSDSIINGIYMMQVLLTKIENQQKELTSTQDLILSHERQKETILLSKKHEASNQAGTSRQADAIPDDTERRNSNQTLHPETKIYEKQKSIEKFIANILAKSAADARNDEPSVTLQMDTLASDIQPIEHNQTGTRTYQKQDSRKDFEAFFGIADNTDNVQIDPNPLHPETRTYEKQRSIERIIADILASSETDANNEKLSKILQMDTLASDMQLIEHNQTGTRTYQKQDSRKDFETFFGIADNTDNV